MKLRAAIVTIDPERGIIESAPDKMFELMDRKTGATEELSYDEFIIVPPFLWDGKSVTVTVTLGATDSQGSTHVHGTLKKITLYMTKKNNPMWDQLGLDSRWPTLNEVFAWAQSTNLFAAECGRAWDLPVQSKLLDDSGLVVSDYASRRREQSTIKGEE